MTAATKNTAKKAATRNQRAPRAPRKKAASVNADVLGPRLVLIVVTLGLVLFGLVMVFSASSVEAIQNNQSPYSFLLKQAAFAVMGILLAFIIWRIVPFEKWRSNWVWWIAGLMLVLMFATRLFGEDVYGARRWIYFGPFSLQPSEFAKIACVLVTAKLYYDYHVYNAGRTKTIALTIVANGIMVFFTLFAQKDLGTTIICLVGLVCVYYFSGAPLRLVGTIALCLVGIGLVGILLQPYRLERIAVLLNPYNDGANGLADGYQYIRSRYALAEGGVFGLGLGNSYEKYQYLPEAETDYIYAIICEELGMVGGILVAIAFVVFLIAGLLVARASRSSYGACISGTFVVMIVFQAFINIFCVVGLFPTTGKPLPFISSGGSSLMASLCMVGFILAASEDSSTMDVYERRRTLFAVFAESVTNKIGEVSSAAEGYAQQKTAESRARRATKEQKDAIDRRVHDQYFEGPVNKRNTVKTEKVKRSTVYTGQESRPRSASRLRAMSGGKSQSNTASRLGGKSQGNTASRLGGKSQSNTAVRSGGKSQSNTAVRPGARKSTKAGTKSTVGSRSKFGAKPSAKSGAKPSKISGQSKSAKSSAKTSKRKYEVRRK